jgi:hypothetical protein
MDEDEDEDIVMEDVQPPPAVPPIVLTSRSNWGVSAAEQVRTLPQSWQEFAQKHWDPIVEAVLIPTAVAARECGLNVLEDIRLSMFNSKSTRPVLSFQSESRSAYKTNFMAAYQ